MQNQTVGSYMPRLPRAQKRRGVLLLKDLATNSRNVIYNTFSLVNMKQLLCFTLGKHIAYYSHSVHFTYDTRLCTPAFFFHPGTFSTDKVQTASLQVGCFLCDAVLARPEQMRSVLFGTFWLPLGRCFFT